MESSWVPRTYPLKGKYNDYGAIEDHEVGPVNDSWIRQFQDDLVVKGVGDNQCHDFAINKTMTFDDLLAAVCGKRGRLEVTREPCEGRALTRKIEEYYPPLEDRVGIPSLQSVTKIIIGLGFEVITNGDGEAPNMFLVDDEDGSEQIRVRRSGFSEDRRTPNDFTSICKAAKSHGYAAMVTQGNDGYMVLIHPGIEAKQVRGFNFRSQEATSKIELAMVREDVWQAMLKMPIFYDSYNPKPSYPALREAAFRCTKMIKVKGDLPWRYRTEDLEKSFSREDEPNGNGLAAQFEHVVNDYHSELPRFLDVAAEFQYIREILWATRYEWRPSHSSGPQFGDWSQHAIVMAGLKELVERHAMAEQEATEAINNYIEQARSTKPAKRKAKKKATTKARPVIKKSIPKKKPGRKK